MKNVLLATAVALPLAACSFGAKPPPSLLTLSSSVPVPVGQGQSSAASPSLSIQIPAVPQALATARVPVQTSDVDVQYLKDAQWVEPPQRLFARLVSDTVTAKTGRVVLSPAQSIADPGAQLAGELRNFGVDGRTREAVVTFDGALVREAGKQVDKRRFEARVPVAEITPGAAAVALNQAANQVAGEIADWIGR
jgi:cholesterol transport system auxiliary component